MNLAALQAISDQNANESQGVYGVFDPDRVPELDIQPFTDVTTINAAVSPDCSYRLISNAISNATETIDLYIYNISADHLLELLSQARDNGIAIRLMYDVMDTRGSEKQKIQALGVPRKEAPSSGGRKVFTVCHQKFAVIDRKSLILGSANWAASAIPKVTVPGKFRKGNREWLIHIEHEGLASWYGELFDADWNIPEMPGPSGAAVAPLPTLVGMETRAAAVTLPSKVFDIYSPDLGAGVTVTPILSPDNYFKLVRDLIRNAQTSIDSEQQYIKVGGSKTQSLLQELSQRKGEVDIRIIVSPAFAEGWEKTVESLEAADLLDRLRAINLDSFTHLHNKGVLVDGKFTVVTSTNMSENSITQARETGVLIESEEIGSYYKQAIDVDWETALDPADVVTHLAKIHEALVTVEEPLLDVHPADLRII